ncbi:MAG: serine/threonine protein kinase [Planctomycetaceae bacterium]|nr:serine/threonine protein kinase [Planctomycetaceae bacterium]MBT4726448.1 serine/threonine protein kinase [Planctomycetaceae bacterium]MBT5125353.1 serine/threonine protein kinase [Planctomycetaceae bacterium]MBT5600430.1 serine/threonine protein kinase [Planctomycetaceae bacterium]MBT5885125.1 serine/threonine protein kinase [Planctomycetaceae bacterium]
MARGHDYIASFRVIRMIRSGSTCQIYEAINDNTGQKVALKTLVAERRKDKTELKYLQHEFEVAKEFKNEFVNDVYEVDAKHSVPYLSIEFSPFQNLKQRLRSEYDLMNYHASTVINNVLQGLKYLHDQGWVHCDVKPDNFLVDDEGSCKLIDFALAVRISTKFGRMFGGGKSKTIAGTRSYMSPEQIRRKSLDNRSDIYSAGCLLTEIATRKVPFTGNTPEDLLARHLRMKAPPICSVNTNITQEFSDLVGEMLSKNPVDRPDSMTLILDRLDSMRIYRTQPLHPSKMSSAEDAEF